MTITVHPGGFIKRNYIEELGLTATELAKKLEVPGSKLNRLLSEKIDLSPVLAAKLSKVLGRSTASWMKMQNNHTLAKCQAEKPECIRILRVLTSLIDAGYRPHCKAARVRKHLIERIANGEFKSEEEMLEARESFIRFAMEEAGLATEGAARNCLNANIPRVWEYWRATAVG